MRHRVLGYVHGSNGQYWCYPGMTLNELEHATIAKGWIGRDEFGF